MPDTYEVQAPDGSAIEIQSDGPPTAANALRAIRAYGDMQAAAAQKTAQEGSTFGSQMTPGNLLHDAGTVAGAGWNVIKSLATEGWKNPLGINQPPLTVEDVRKQQPSLSVPSAGTLRTLPTRAWEAVKDPIGALQTAGVTPDIAAQAGANVAALAATGAVLPRAGELTQATGGLVTRAGEAMNPTLTKNIGRALGGITGLERGGGIGGFSGQAIGAGAGEMLPPATRAAGRLITKAGQLMGSERPIPTGSPYARYTPSSGVERPLAPDEQVPPEGANVRYNPSNETSRPLTPEEQVAAEVSNVRYQPSSGIPRPLTPEEQVAADVSNVKYQPSNETSRPLTPDEQVPPEGANVRYTPSSGVLRTQPPATAAVTEAPPTVVPADVLRTTPVEAPPVETAPVEPPATAPVTTVAPGEAAPDEGRIFIQTKADARAQRMADTVEERAARQRQNAVARRQAIEEELQGLVDQTVDAAKRGGWQGDSDAETSLRDALRQELDARHQFLKENAADVPNQDSNPQTLLRDIAKYGGITERAGGQVGETRGLKEFREPNGTINGVRGVIKDSGGLTLDGMLEALQGEGRYKGLTLNDIVTRIEAASKAGKTPTIIEQLKEGTSTDELLNKFGLNPPADDVTFDPTEFEGESQGRLPGAEQARQVGKADTSFKAPVQASGEDFSLDARTAAQKAADAMKAEQEARGPGLFGEGNEGRPPAPEERSSLEQRRAEVGSAQVAQEEGAGKQDVRDITRSADQGEKGPAAGVFPTKVHGRIQATIEQMIADGATDQELRDYADFRRDGKPNDPKTRSNIITILRTLKRPVYAAAGAAAGGAALRKALVSQLQDDGKDQ